MLTASTNQLDERNADDQLLAEFLVAQGEDAFERLMVRFGPMVLRICRDVLDDHAEAEDAFQETFLHLFNQASSIQNRGSVRFWLGEVASRVALRTRYRRSKRRFREQQVVTPAGAPAVDEEVARSEWQPILREEIRRLPPKLRAAIELHHLEGLTVEVAARQLNCPSGTFKSRLVKGREQLRDRLARRGVASSLVFLLLFWSSETSRAAEVPDRLYRKTRKAVLAASLAAPEAAGSFDLAAAPAEFSPPRRLPRSVIALLVTLGLMGWSVAILTLMPLITARPGNPVLRFFVAWLQWVQLAGRSLCP